MKQSKVLITGYKKLGKNDNNSSFCLLEQLTEKNHFFFTNNFKIISEEVSKILEDNWDIVIMFGQKPIIKRLSIETSAKLDEEVYETNYDLKELEDSLKKKEISYKFSHNAGNHYCNYIYYQMMKQIREKNLKTQAIFIHVPYLKNFKEMDKVVSFLKEYI